MNANYSDWRNYSKNNNDKNTRTNVVDQDSVAHSFDFRIKTVFIVGQTNNDETQANIIEESRKHNDLIQERFFDSYNNLTLKTLMMLKWVTTNCADNGNGSYSNNLLVDHIIYSRIFRFPFSGFFKL